MRPGGRRVQAEGRKRGESNTFARGKVCVRTRGVRHKRRRRYTYARGTMYISARDGLCALGTFVLCARKRCPFFQCARTRVKDDRFILFTDGGVAVTASSTSDKLPASNTVFVRLKSYWKELLIWMSPLNLGQILYDTDGDTTRNRVISISSGHT